MAFNLLDEPRGDAKGVVFSIFKENPDPANKFFDLEYPNLNRTANIKNKSTFVLPYLRAHYGNFTGKWYRVPYSLENYPLESLILRCS